MRVESRLFGYLILLPILLAGCQGSSDNSSTVVAPSGLTEHDSSVVYAVDSPIVTEVADSSGGSLTQCSVSPPLPAGLVLDSQTCAISGAPTAVTPDAVYMVTGNNPAGSETIRVELEVKAHAIAPENLGYLDATIVYVTAAPITPNVPITTGGEITQYSVSPALPAGLALDPQTGIISGTPTVVTAPAVYTVTGSNNSVDSIQTQLNIEVQAQVVPPTSLDYLDPVPVYIVGEPITYNEPQPAGGEITQYSVTPALPAGLSINTLTGVISGTPTTAQSPATYTVTGSNSAGSVTAQIVIDVNLAVLGEWLPADAMNQGRNRHTATLLTDGQVLVAGGYNRGALSSAELYNPTSGSWSTTSSLGQARQYLTATLLPNGRVLVAGGSDSASTSQSSAELYDPATGTWSGTGSMSQARDSHTATLLTNGKVLVAGGEGDSGALASAELYDPATGTWSSTGSMAQARYFHTATLLADGRVLVAGGFGTPARLSSAEIYDPATGTWSPVGSLAQARVYHTAALLPDGRVLVAGGYNGTVLASVEVFNPATGAWSATGNLNNARYFHAAILLPDGKVLVAGGNGSVASGYLFSAELYDPAAGTWSLTGSLHHARRQPTATLLPDGRVLAAGGVGPGYLSSSELFH